MMYPHVLAIAQVIIAVTASFALAVAHDLPEVGVGGNTLHPGLEARSRPVAGRSLRNAQPVSYSVTPDEDGMLRLSEAPEASKRPFKIAFIYDFESTESQDNRDYVQNRLMPAVSSYLGRWMRVRHPSGPLNFRGTFDFDGATIPPGPEAGGSYDADYVLRVKTVLSNSPRCSFPISGTEVLYEPLTRRPIFGQLQLCDIDTTFFLPLQDALHEMLHILGFTSVMYEKWMGYRRLEEIVRTVLPEDETEVVGPIGIGEYRALISPNVVREAGRHFGCPELVGGLLEERPGELTDHWSMRHYIGALMRAGYTGRNIHFGREAMTDVTLAMLQDTRWYDVKYGSGGFDPYGYKAGCAFVSGTNDETLADPVARQFLCRPEQVGERFCFFDFSGQGVCEPQRRYRDEVYDDLFTVNLEYEGGTLDCQSAPGARCINEMDNDGVRDLLCGTQFSCSPTGQVLVEGLLCEEFLGRCPPDELMCGRPGLLTCATPELNDCNGRGDCCEGRCFCHLGWGGDACTVPVCTTGCPGGEPCPPSGFCGVPECGSWSVGDTGEGEPCDK